VIRVLVVDDHAVVRAGLAQLLTSAPGIELAGEAGDGAGAVAAAERLAPDVVLMDLAMPVMDGVEATRRVRVAAPDAQVVVLTSFTDRDRILDALEAGATGYLLKDAEPEELLRGIRAAAAGEAPLDPKAARALLDARAAAATRPALTAREREVLALLGEGLPNKLIAARLGISEKTVKAHLTRVYAALGVWDRTGAALWAREHGAG
jgi:DNA-binding NarL/FixJ family response regulator